MIGLAWERIDPAAAAVRTAWRVSGLGPNEAPPLNVNDLLLEEEVVEGLEFIDPDEDDNEGD